MVTRKQASKIILQYLKAEYEMKGHNFFFSAKKVKIKGYSNYLTGSCLGKMYDSGVIEQWKDRKSHPKLYKTRF